MIATARGVFWGETHVAPFRTLWSIQENQHCTSFLQLILSAKSAALGCSWLLSRQQSQIRYICSQLCIRTNLCTWFFVWSCPASLLQNCSNRDLETPVFLCPGRQQEAHKYGTCPANCWRGEMALPCTSALSRAQVKKEFIGQKSAGQVWRKHRNKHQQAPTSTGQQDKVWERKSCFPCAPALWETASVRLFRLQPTSSSPMRRTFSWIEKINARVGHG